jgi:hypothetical protein
MAASLDEVTHQSFPNPLIVDGGMQSSIRRHSVHWVYLLAAALLTALVSPVADAQSARAAGQFDLTITKSSMLKPGKSHIESKNANVTFTNEFFRGRVNALKIEMPGAENSSAVFVLLLNSAKHITEASLSIIVPGKTVLRTLAWTPADLEKYFSDCRYENDRLHLKSKGSYAESAAEVLTMSWDVDIDAPVVTRIR